MFKKSFWTYSHLSSIIVAVFASTRSMKFSKVAGQRITSGATEIGHMTREDMSTTVCASFCDNNCGMFHFSTVTNECSLFLEKNYDAGVTVASDPDWNTSFRSDHTTVHQGDWTLVFRAQAGVGDPTWESWSNTGVFNDNPVPQNFPVECLRFTRYSSCDRHFRSHILDNWVNIEKVRVSFTKSDSEVAYILFNGTGTDRDSWFSVDRILDSTWSPALDSEQLLTSPGIYGHYYVPYASRRFYLFGPHNGCEYDWVYTMAMDFPVDTCISHGLWHISIGNVPNLFYSPSPTGRASFRTDGAYPLVEKADVLAVWVKFA